MLLAWLQLVPPQEIFSGFASNAVSGHDRRHDPGVPDWSAWGHEPRDAVDHPIAGASENDCYVVAAAVADVRVHAERRGGDLFFPPSS